MLEQIRVSRPDEPYFNFGSNVTNSLEDVFLNSPILIFMSAALLAALPLAAALFTPIQFQYEYDYKKKARRSCYLNQSPDDSPSFEHPHKKVSKVEATEMSLLSSKDVPRRTPLIVLRDFFLFHAREFCGKFSKIPHRFFAFFVDAFYIPQYRSEWGQYRIWSFRAPDRKPMPPLVKEEMRHLKRDERRKSREYKEKVEGCRGDTFLPHPTPHNHLDCMRVRINVNGCIFETQERTLRAFPNSLLGNPSKRIQYYDPASNALFFDRSRNSFEAILHFFQTGGMFRRPDNVHLDVFLDDAEFYGVPQSVIEDFRKEEGVERDDDPRRENVPNNLYMRKLWLLFDNPTSSHSAKILAWLSIFVVMISIVTFIAETHVAFSKDEITEHQIDLSDPFYLTETVSVMWFTLELFFRIISCPSKSAFFSSTLNIIDICSVLPYFITLITVSVASSGSSTVGKGGAYWAIQAIGILRLIRVLRVFKLSRHSEGLKILGRTLQASISELFLLVFFVLIGIILFSSAMYLIEGSINSDFSSIPAGFWWAMITMTTVGYGDDVPRSWLGKFVGSLCAIAGVFTIALPVPVIVSNFNYFYHQAIDEAQFNLAKIFHVSVCPFRPGGGGDYDYEQHTARHTESDPVLLHYTEPDSDSEFESLKFEVRKRKNVAVRVDSNVNIKK